MVAAVFTTFAVVGWVATFTTVFAATFTVSIIILPAMTWFYLFPLSGQSKKPHMV